ncbi:MAG: hypothetical protein R2710_03735 [Acidimicrobiales bacterium]
MAEPEHAGLSNVAATVFNLLGYEAPADYDRASSPFESESVGGTFAWHISNRLLAEPAPNGGLGSVLPAHGGRKPTDDG